MIDGVADAVGDGTRQAGNNARVGQIRIVALQGDPDGEDLGIRSDPGNAVTILGAVPVARDQAGDRRAMDTPEWGTCRRPDPLKSGPVTTEPARSGCVESTPVSSTATVTPEPLLDSHAVVTCSALSHHSSWRGWSATAGAAVSATHATASPAASAAGARRGSLLATTSTFPW